MVAVGADHGRVLVDSHQGCLKQILGTINAKKNGDPIMITRRKTIKGLAAGRLPLTLRSAQSTAVHCRAQSERLFSLMDNQRRKYFLNLTETSTSILVADHE